MGERRAFEEFLMAFPYFDVIDLSRPIPTRPGV